MAAYTIEDVELLRKKGGMTYQEAVALLEYHNGNLARALIDLEKNGRLKDEKEAAGNTEKGTVNGNAKKHTETKEKALNLLQKLYRCRAKVHKGDVTVVNLSVLYAGACLLVAFIRFSALFNGSCIGKRPVTIEVLQRLPFCIAVTDAAGNVSYRVAVFLLEAVLMVIAYFIVMAFCRSSRTVQMYYPCKSAGNVWRIFLVCYSCIEIITDSLRTDSPLMHFTFLTSLNAYSAFISFAQVTAVALLLYVFLYYLICSIVANGFSWKHLLAVVLFLASLIGVGYFGEYSIQRFGTIISGYVIMSLSLLVIAVTCALLYRSCAPEPDYYD